MLTVLTQTCRLVIEDRQGSAGLLGLGLRGRRPARLAASKRVGVVSQQYEARP
jgi:hypothetical protein